MHPRHVEERGPGVVELVLLLPAPEAEGLEKAATRHGLTVGRLFRRRINEFLERQAGSLPS